MKGMFKTIKRTPHNLGTKVGLAKKSTDPEFNEAQRNFSTLETTTDKFIKETKAFNEAVVGLFTAGASFATHFTTILSPIGGEYDLIGKHPEAESTIKNVNKLLAVQEELRASVSPELELIESRILAPMKEFREVLKSIRKTITKRDHKLTDYDRFNNSLTKLRDKKEKTLNDEKNLFKLEQDFEVATAEYEAINNAMKADIPRFMTLAAQFIDPLFESFYYMQLNIYYLIVEKMTSFVEDAKLDISGNQDIAAEYLNKKTDAQERVEALNIIKRILSVSRLVQVARAQQQNAGTGTGNLNRSATMSSTTSSLTTSSSLRGPPPPKASSGGYKKAPPPPPTSAASALSRNPPPPYSAAINGAASASSPAAATTTAAAAKRPPPPPPPIKPKPKPRVQYVVALYDFTAQADGDLSFQTGDRIEIVERTASTEDWWTGRLHGQQGVFPGNYVQEA